MQYKGVERAVFLKRTNRFIAEIERAGKKELCHVKNTGRCKDLLVRGADIYISRAENQQRKTKYDLISVKKDDQIVNVDSQIPNYVVREWLQKKELFRYIKLVKPETRYGSSRFDFFVEADGCQSFIEVKGVTLEENGVARFPDAPTERGVKHINELIECKSAGFDAYIIFVIQMKGIASFEPNDKIHQAFGDALREAAKAGVNILAYDCQVSADEIFLDRPVRINL